MLRSIVGLPIRLGVRFAGVAVHGTAEVADRAFGLVGLVSNALSGPRHPDVDLDGSPHDGASARRSGAPARPRAGRPSPPPAAAEPSPPAAVDEPTPPAAVVEPSPPAAVVEPSPPAAVVEPPPSPALPDADTPVHVSEEPTLVESFAEKGAQDGAGAEIHVAEPWDGYREMKADDVIDRLAGSTTAVLATVQLYESSSRQRQRILTAVERELKRASG